MGCSNSQARDSDNKNEFKGKGSKKPIDASNLKINKPNINAKGGNGKTLNNKDVTVINQSALNITKYYLDQQPPESDDPWCDDLFPATVNSIWGKDSNGVFVDPDTKRTSDYTRDFISPDSKIEFKRPGEIFEGGVFNLFEDSISIDDIRQGSVGNCYFMSAISSLAQNPQLIVQIFRDLDVKANGCYEIAMRLDGEWQVVLVDDQIPVSEGSKTPLFSKPVGSELWVMLLEKAWAKVNGGYLNIVGGWPTEVLPSITNFPADQTWNTTITDKDANWKKLLTNSQNGCILSCCSASDKAKEDGVGIVANHAYSLLWAKEGKVGGKNIRLLRIRNPWGNHEWTGDWSDSSPLWTNEAKKVFGDQTKLDDGCFCMLYEDFLVNYNSSECLLVSSPFITVDMNVSADDSEKPRVFELQVHNKINVKISGQKPYWRWNRKIGSKNCLPMTIMLLKKDNGKLQFIAIRSDTASPVIDKPLDPGNYLVFTYCHWAGAVAPDNYDRIYPYNVSFGSNDFFQVTDLGVDEEFSLLRAGLIEGIKVLRANDIKGDKPTVMDNGFPDTFIGYNFLFNNTSNPLNVKVEDKTQNQFLLYPTAVQDQSYSISPGAVFLILGHRSDIWGSYLFWTPTTETDSGDNQIDNPNIDNFLQNQESKEISEEGYIYKKIDIDYSKFSKHIDAKEVALTYYTGLYPDIMAEITKVPELTDGVPIKFMDKISWGETFSFSECKIDQPSIKHGRGMYFWTGGTKWVGQYIDDKCSGPCVLSYSDGSRIEINYKENQMDGEGIQYGSDGSQSKCQYDNGKFVKWL